MSFAVQRDILLATLREISGLEKTTQYEDFAALNAGVDFAVVVQLDEVVNEENTFGEDLFTYRFLLKTYTRHVTNIAESRSAQDSLRDAIIDKLGANRGNENTPLYQIFRSSRLEREPRAVGSVQFIVETMSVDVQEARSY